MQRVFILLCIVLVAAVGSEARWGHHSHYKENASPAYPACHFMSDKGTYDLRLFMRDLQGKDWEITSATEADSKFYFNPCGAVQNENCPKDSALCQITPKNEAISFGASSPVQWTEVDGGVELSYDNGEMCNTGVPRKTVIQMSCSEPNSELSTHLTSLNEIVVDDCQVTVKLTSMYACPVEQLCSVFDKPSCEHSEGLCQYNEKEKTCAMNSVSCTRIGHHHLSHGAIVGVCVAAFSLMLCGCACCALACRKRRQQCRRRRLAKTSRIAKKAVVATPIEQAPIAAPVDEESVVPMQEQQQAVYIPMQQPVYMYQPHTQYSYAQFALAVQNPTLQSNVGTSLSTISREQWSN